LPFVSNGRLIEVINQNDAYLDEGIEEKKRDAWRDII